jgi:5'-AMP-activated protein kinase catalytic alpha subunit
MFESLLQFYKNFSSGLKDVVWNTDAAAEEQKQ